MSERKDNLDDGRLKRRPARCQMDPSEVHENSKPEQTGQTFNIWYSKWTGGDDNGKQGLVHAKHRCDVRRDSGYTKADKYITDGQLNRSNYICLYFARGYCCNGKNCDYLHRTPTELDVFSSTFDCFGRERFLDYKDDMSGIGSFGRINKTLYVGGISTMSGNIEMAITKCFDEFGDIDYVKVLPQKNSAFVSYKLESQAQFAKEAMHCQSLTPGNETETLNIRWANKDPSFNARKREREDQNQMTMDTARKLLEHLRNENINKKQKITVKNIDGKAETEDNVSNYTNFTENIGIDQGSLFVLAKLRTENNKPTANIVPSVSVVTGYSSSDESDTN